MNMNKDNKDVEETANCCYIVIFSMFFRKCEKDGQALLWQFMVNGDIEFDIIRIENADKVTVWPKLTLTTIKTPEQGFIRCRKGEYYVRFTNPANSWIPLKLHYVVEMGPY